MISQLQRAIDQIDPQNVNLAELVGYWVTLEVGSLKVPVVLTLDIHVSGEVCEVTSPDCPEWAGLVFGKDQIDKVGWDIPNDRPYLHVSPF